MYIKFPKDDKKTVWTKHVKEKMRFYGLSESRLRRVLSNPKRRETGIAPDTIAIMQPTGSEKHPTEIWLMYKKIGKKINPVPKNSHVNGIKPLIATDLSISPTSPKASFRCRVKIITAWRYPGISPVREPPPIPDDIAEELVLE